MSEPNINKDDLTRSDHERFFGVSSLSKNLKKKSTRGAAITTAGQASMSVIQIGSTAILARLLTPEDYGLIAMVGAVTGFLGIFRDAGLTWATVQREEITHDQVSNLFWINSALGCALAFVVAALSPAIAAFYGEPRLVSVSCVLASVFVFGGFTVQHQALLRRQMRFGALTMLQVISTVVGIVAAVSFAKLGFGYWALVMMAVAAPVSHLLGTLILVPWKPGLPKRGTGVAPLLKFGTDIMGFNVVNYFSRNADNILIGWWWGSAALGLYQKAYTLLMVPIRQFNSPISAVAVPALSRAKGNPERFCHYFANSLMLVASVAAPIVVGIAVFADEIVMLWLGPVWAETATLFRAMAPAALVFALLNPLGWILISQGESRRYRQVGTAIAIVIVVSFAIGLRWGPKGVAAASSVASCIVFFPVWSFVVKGTPVSVRRVMGAYATPVVSCLLATVVAFAVNQLETSSFSGWIRTLTAAVAFASTYLFMLLVAFRKWHVFREIITDLLPTKRNEKEPESRA